MDQELHLLLIQSPRPRLIELARLVNRKSKIKDVYKMKKDDLVTELMLRQDMTNQVFGQSIDSIKKEKKGLTNDEKNKILLKNLELYDLAMEANDEVEKDKYLKMLNQNMKKLKK